MSIITPNWPDNAGVRALTTTRDGGVSRGPFGSLNMAAHVGDDAAAVTQNQQRCFTTHGIPHVPRWLRQVHGTRAVNICEIDSSFAIEADAAYTDVPDHVCAILTADCLPIIVRNDAATEVAVIHAGWKGLLHGVVQSTLMKFSAPRPRLTAWIGPGISQSAYVVDPTFRHRFLDSDPALAQAFRCSDGRWHADLYAIAEQRLRDGGVTNVSRYRGCTFAEPDRFYSYRRDGATGRMATLVWIDSGHHHHSASEF